MNRARLRSTPSALFWLTACAPTAVACAAVSPRVDAAPRASQDAREADRPLITGELKDAADIARALREHYVKYEARVPMRDGVRLFTTYYVPKDRTRAWPMMLERTPYGVAPYGVDNLPTDPRALTSKIAPSPAFVRDGFIFVHQDVRGRMMSEGTFVDVRPHRAGNTSRDVDESTDAFDTIDWLVKNVPANNGRVGAWGISYPGFYAAQAAVSAHPALKAVSPQAPVTDWFVGDDFHHNGAFFIADALAFYANFGRERPKPTPKAAWDFATTGDVYDFFLRLGPIENANTTWLENKIPFWNDLTTHPTRDAFWQARDPRPLYKTTRGGPALMTVGGWFDAEDLFGALATYRAFEAQSPGADNTLVMGPWAHGGWARSEGESLGDIDFGDKTSRFYRDHVELPFFARHLKNRALPRQPEAWIFETGTNVWNAFPAWPPREARLATLYLHAHGGLSGAPPMPREDESGADAYVSDPDHPVPYDAHPSAKLDHSYMIGDQRFAARRPDVLTYETTALEGDVTLAGPIVADLFVTSTGTDADFVVKLVDVFPDDAEDPEPNPRGVHMAGYQMLVRGEVMRARFRDGLDKPAPLRPGEPTRISITLPDVAHTFRASHRMMVQIQSTWFPLVDRNPQTFVDPYHAKASDFHAATERVLRTPERASALRLTLLRGALPTHAP